MGQRIRFADFESKRPVEITTLFQVGSISKPVAAVAAMKMVEEGKLALDQDINTFLTSWKLPDNEFTKERRVTLREILSHSAGLTVHGFPGYARPWDDASNLARFGFEIQRSSEGRSNRT